MRKFLIISIVMLMTGAIEATEQQRLEVVMHDGTTYDIMLWDLPVVKIADGKMTITTTVNTLELDRGNVKEFKFYGDLSSVEEIKAPEYIITRGPESIEFRNLPAGSRIEIYSVSGMFIRRLSSEGDLSIDMSGYAKGVYIVRVNEYSTKIIL